MIEKIIQLLNLNDWYSADEYIHIAKGKYAIPKNIKDVKQMAMRHLKNKS